MQYTAAEQRARMRRQQDQARRRARNVFIAGCLAVLALLGTGVFVAFNVWNGTKRDMTITVTDKNRVCDSTGKSVSCYYLVYTDQGTFKDTDSLLNGKFSSSDLYGQLRRDGRYKVQVQGWRIPWLSEYPNIVRIEQTLKEGSDARY